MTEPSLVIIKAPIDKSSAKRDMPLNCLLP